VALPKRPLTLARWNSHVPPCKPLVAQPNDRYATFRFLSTTLDLRNILSYTSWYIVLF
jgi:hypothetical protein